MWVDQASRLDAKSLGGGETLEPCFSVGKMSLLASAGLVYGGGWSRVCCILICKGLKGSTPKERVMACSADTRALPCVR